MISTLFISPFLMRIEFVLTGFFCFSPSQLLLRQQVIKGKKSFPLRYNLEKVTGFQINKIM